IILFRKINANFRRLQEALREKEHLRKELSIRDRLVDHQRSFTENFIDSLRSGLIIIDISGITILVNEQARDLLQLKQTDFTGISYKSFVPSSVQVLIEKLIPGGDPTIPPPLTEKIRIKETCLQVSGHTMLEKDGTAIGAIFLFQDITEQENTTVHLYRTEKLATLGTMLSGISHELRNPLSIISARAQRAQTAAKTDRAGMLAMFESIERQAERCASIVNNLLDFARHRATSMGFHRIGDVLDEALTHVAYQNVFDNISIEKKYADDLHVYGDRSRLVQVMLNIISNAADAMNGRGTVILETGIVDSQSIMVTITDTGPGIDQDIRKKVFDPFFTTKDPGKGTGLGLAIVQKIVAESGGEIAFSSQPGKTSFFISLPAGKGKINE
ncbi:MAG: PAS domain-containing protein, partial [Chitinivibrionales bacterium]|nr:PAS domain-containing protein [Chitinivibrionales bacterium]